MEVFLQIDMANISVYIWGMRYGFQSNTALFPEKVRLTDPADIKQYENVVKYFSDEKDNYFRQCDKDFYFMLKDSNYKMYSHVYSRHKDIAGRISWLVFTIVISANTNLKGDIISALHRLKELYKKKNADNKENRNLFTSAQIHTELGDLQTVNDNESQFKHSNTLIYYSNENELKGNFRSFEGNELYFIQENTNGLMIDQISPKPKSLILSNMVNKQNEANNINKNFRTILDLRSDFEKAKKIYQDNSQLLNDSSIQIFLEWKKEIEINKVLLNTVNDFNLKFEEIIENERKNQFISNDLEARIETHYHKLPKYIQDNYNLWKNQFKENEKKPPSIEEEIVWVKEQITDAKNKIWTIDYSYLLKKIKDTQGLSAAVKENQIDLGPWIAGFNSCQTEKCKEKIKSLYEETQKKIPKNQIESNVRDLKTKLTNLKHQVNELKDTEAKYKFRTDEKFKYLDSEKWIPKNRKPLYRKLAVTILLLTLTTVGFFALKYIGVGEVEKKSDKDFDGIEDNADREVNTVWFKDTTNYRVRNYVNVYGKIDTSKTKHLCNCWEFPKAEDRKILLCTDTENWFVFENTLYEYREINPGDGNFYSDTNSKVASTKDNEIEEKHKKLFSAIYDEIILPEDTTIKDPPVENNKMVVITYNTKSYKIKIGFTTDKGLFYNNSNYRFKNKKWQRQRNPPNGEWGNPDEGDIPAMFKAKGIKPIEKDINTPEVKKKAEAEVKKKVEGNDDKTDHSSYWINLDKKSDDHLKNISVLIRRNIADEAYKCKPGSAGATARLIIISRLNKL